MTATHATPACYGVPCQSCRQGTASRKVEGNHMSTSHLIAAIVIIATALFSFGFCWHLTKPGPELRAFWNEWRSVRRGRRAG